MLLLFAGHYHHEGVGKPVGADKKRGSKTPREVFGRAITEMRVKRGISQVSMADTLGYSSNYLGLIERGIANPTCDVMAAISGYFRMSIAEFWTNAEALQATGTTGRRGSSSLRKRV